MASTRSGRPWTRASVASWLMTGTPSAEARTSNSRPSQAGSASAAGKAASEFSVALRQSPRWARRRVRGPTILPYPIASQAAIPRWSLG